MDTDGERTPQPHPQPTQQGPSDAELWRALLESVVATGQTTQSLQANQERHAQLMDAMVSRIVSQSTSAPRAPPPKIREPRMFSGKGDEVVPFLREIRAAIFLQRATYQTDYEKSLYFSLYLKDGNPISWFNSVELKHPELLRDFESLLAAFRKRFEDSNITLSKLQKLERLEQTGSAAAYANQFQELLVYIDISDFMQITQFNRGLKPKLREILLNVQKLPETLEEWLPIVIETDNRLHSLEVEMKHKTGSKSSSTNKASTSTTMTLTTAQPSSSRSVTAPTASTSGVTPMEVDAMRRGPITEAEKARRRREGLCFYCGQGKHRVTDCPNMSEEAKKNRVKAFPSAGKA